ncbi:MAG: thioredoxin family protein [Myxococcales bacterium]|nr:thioredoxin family protein [Myxococcales bacterium]
MHATAVAPSRAGGAKPVREDLIAELRATQALATALLEDIARLPWPERLAARSRVAPQPGDWARVFAGEWAERARVRYEAWLAEEPLVPHPGLHGARVTVTGVIPAGMFATDNPASRQHKGGYRQIAAALQPDLHWVSWRVEGDDQRRDYDGLVRVEGERFAWFPTPWVALTAPAPAPAPRAPVARVTRGNLEELVTDSAVALLCYDEALSPAWEQLARDHGPLRFGFIDVADQAKLTQEAGVRALPTVQIFREQILLYHEAGPVDVAALTRTIERVLALDMDDVRAQIAARE